MNYVQVEAVIPMRVDKYFELMQRFEYDEFAADFADNLESAHEDESIRIPESEFKHYVPAHHISYVPDAADEDQDEDDEYEEYEQETEEDKSNGGAEKSPSSSQKSCFLTPQAGQGVLRRKVSLKLKIALPWAVKRLLGLDKLSVQECRTYLRHRTAALPPRENWTDHPIYKLIAARPEAGEFFEILYVSKPPVLQEQLSCYGSLFLFPEEADSCRLVNICYPVSNVPGFSSLLLSMFSKEIKYAYSLVPQTVSAWKQSHPETESAAAESGPSQSNSPATASSNTARSAATVSAMQSPPPSAKL